MMIAALFVDESGPYTRLNGVDAWGEARDARKYNGPYPVVAHPPCQRWGRLAPVNNKRWGTPIGDDNGCFESALKSVRMYGGVLEHPAHTIAYKAFNIQKPKDHGWNKISEKEWVGEVWQSDYGHKASKRTWLLYVGCVPPKPFRQKRARGTYQVGGGIHTGNRSLPRMPQKETHLTPPLFRDYLIELAIMSNGV